MEVGFLLVGIDNISQFIPTLKFVDFSTTFGLTADCKIDKRLQLILEAMKFAICDFFYFASYYFV